MQAIVVDDDNISLFLTKKTIERYTDFKPILEFSNPEVALNFLKEDQTNDSIAMLIDINMPVMDGWELIEKIEKENLLGHYNHAYIYLLTSSIDPGDYEKSKNSKTIRGFFTKPLSEKHIAQIPKN